MSTTESSSKPYDEMSEQEQEEHDRAARAKEQADQDGMSLTLRQLIYPLITMIL